MGHIDIIENEIYNSLPTEEVTEQIVIDAMRYSLKAGGKRIRPLLVLYFAEACGASAEKALPFAAAIEMVHTYSLIHDDLPCMDDDDLRRGKPSNHKVFGEDIALLAGDALLTNAFAVMLSERAVSLVGAEKCVKCARILADCAGMTGMIGGQVIDLQSEGKSVPIEIIREMHLKKTSCLIKAACMMGVVAGGGDEEAEALAEEYGTCLGLAFQIMDDILDVTASEEELGKPIGSDKENEKSTFVTLLGIDECKKLVKEYTESAISALSGFRGNTDSLRETAVKMSERKS